jgi:hypothetical protein
MRNPDLYIQFGIAGFFLSLGSFALGHFVFDDSVLLGSIVTCLYANAIMLDNLWYCFKGRDHFSAKNNEEEKRRFSLDTLLYSAVIIFGNIVTIRYIVKHY